MNSPLKTIAVVTVMAVVAYGVYVTLTRTPQPGESTTPGPTVEMPAAPSAGGANVAGPGAPASEAAPLFDTEVSPPAPRYAEEVHGTDDAPRDEGDPPTSDEEQAAATEAAVADAHDDGFAVAADDPFAAQDAVPAAAVTTAPAGEGPPPRPTAEPAPLDAQFDAALDELQRLLEEGQLAAALRTLTQWYDNRDLSPAHQTQVLELLDQLAGTVVYSREHHLAQPYVVQFGDDLRQVADRYRVPWQLLARINGISDPAVLEPGTELKVVPGPFDAVVDIERGWLTLLVDNCFAGRFPIGVGGDHPPDAQGDYHVRAKTEKPQYTTADGTRLAAGDPNNPLGGYWIDLGGQVAIHGARSQAELGAADAAGHILLAPRDIEDVFGILSVGSTVVIRR